MTHKHIKTLYKIGIILQSNEIPFIVVGSVARLLKGEDVSPYDIDIFMDIKYLKQARIVLIDFIPDPIIDYKDESGVYKEFHFEVNGIPIEICELNDIDLEKCTLVEVNDLKVYCGD